MKQEKLEELCRHMFEFMPVYHKKIGGLFHSDDDGDIKLNKNQKKALFIIQGKGKITSSELGKCMEMQKGSMTTLVDSLESLGFINREPDEYDRRKVWLSLSEKGDHYIDHMTETYKRKFVSLFSTLEEEEIESMITSIKYIIDKMKRI